MAQESGPGRPNSLFDPAPEEEQTPLLNLTARIEAARSQPRPSPPEGRVGRPPPPGRDPSDPAASEPVRPRKLVFSPADTDPKPQLTPIGELFPGERAHPRAAIGRAAVVASAIVAFVFLNAALLGYLPFVERRPTPPLRPMRQAATPAPEPEPTLVTPPVIASAPALRPPETPAEPASAPPTARIAPTQSPAPAPAATSTATALKPTAPSVVAPAPLSPRPIVHGLRTPETASPTPPARVLPTPYVAAPAPAHVQPLTAPPAPRTAPSATAPQAPAQLESARRAPVALVGGTFAVQVGAFKTDALADGALDRAIAASPASGAALTRKHEPVEKDGGTLYRALLSGFATSKEAGQYCTHLKSAGMACIIKR